jgi:hypothetical protein
MRHSTIIAAPVHVAVTPISRHPARRPAKPLALLSLPGYCKGMVDLKLQVPATDEVEVDAETLAAIDRGIRDADEGRTVPIDEVRKMIPKWISKFESQKAR